MSRRSNNDRARKKRRASERFPINTTIAAGKYLATAGGTVSGTLAMSTALFLSGPRIRAGSGDPESSITAVVGSIWLRTDLSGTACLYVKQSGTGNTGWVLK